MKKYYLLGFSLIFVVICFYALFFGVIHQSPLSSDTVVWGAFGSYFGGVIGPILSFLTFVILAKTLILQQETFRSQNKEQARQRLYSEIELCFSNLEKLEKQFDTILNEPAGTLDNRSMKEALDTIEGKIDRNNPNVTKAAEALVRNLVFISYYVADIERKLNEYYQDESGFASLSFKQYWILKYRPLAKNCLGLVPDNYLTIQQRQCLLDGLEI
ncbi:hypothetical protein O4N70_05950 [Vibrio parahaemolyticus]|uniref:hypothetical protein n=1 Tax=Vibrio parahaemolyticus TaxID=670 RepID=UPI00215BE637|nr:hypothetical protein [Vibrio parahaemolyticus]MCR9731287.1 hypothetical protein [Vibrio parahaemolyticus]MCR9751476.1 hypothetical protein [Vibrio parahaemolyticus]MCR9788201.1 hypothetical protein [Vibrio parahaemolyticus]MCR9862587.1 hypothetical protein [Vibrio parahaemolyticus]MCZ6414187.1 hypothetical protein [Vibrio parahaemolyticus]